MVQLAKFGLTSDLRLLQVLIGAICKHFSTIAPFEGGITGPYWYKLGWLVNDDCVLWAETCPPPEPFACCAFLSRVTLELFMNRWSEFLGLLELNWCLAFELRPSRVPPLRVWVLRCNCEADFRRSTTSSSSSSPWESENSDWVKLVPLPLIEPWAAAEMLLRWFIGFTVMMRLLLLATIMSVTC